MRYLLLPVTLLTWMYLGYFALYFGMIGTVWVFSLSWFWLLVLSSTLIGLILGVVAEFPAFLMTLLLTKLYKSKNWIGVLHSIAGAIGIILFCVFIYQQPPTYSINGETYGLIKGFWEDSWFKTIILFFPVAILFFATSWAFSILPSQTIKGKERIIPKNSTKDIIYGLVDDTKKDRYQRCFERILEVTNVDNETLRTKKGNYDKEISNKDWDKQIEIVQEFEKTTGLKGIVVQTMLEQYFWADEIQREMEKSIWIDKVMNREKTDYFPTSNFIYYNVMEGKK